MFEWTDQQRMVRDVVRDFCANEIEPHVDALESGEMLPYEIMRKLATTFGLAEMARAGYARRKAQSEPGGGGASADVDAAADDDEPDAGPADQDPGLASVVGIELSRVSPGLSLAMGASIALCGRTIMTKGSDAQKERWGLPVVTMEKIGAWGLTEPDTGSDAFAMRTAAVPDGDGYVLNGSKTLVTNAPFADVLVVYAKIVRDGGDGRVHGFIFEKGTEGLSVGKPFHKFGMNASPTGEIFLENVRATRANLLGEAEKEPSRRQAVSILEGERSGSPILALGIIERCIEESLRYAKERVQFGRPIADHQLVQAKLARMYMHRAVVRNFVFQMLWLQSQGKRAMVDACAAKLYCGTAAVEVGLDAIQIRGGLGYLKEGGVERFARDAKLLEIGGGTNDIQMLTIARHMLRDDFRLD